MKLERAALVLCGCTITVLSLVSVVLANPGSFCHAKQWKLVSETGVVTFSVSCIDNDCTGSGGSTCEITGSEGWPDWVTCVCTGNAMHCNAAIRTQPGVLEVACLGGCPPGQGTACPEPASNPYTLVHTYPDGSKQYLFECACAGS